ncbi:MAG TPA: hypothetical protein DCL15_02425 [Chloroflexi bacterium]|nr:hypothetical protein [Chloroflexota bacterium]
MVNVRPRGGEQLYLMAPITVGVASTTPAKLTPDASTTQQLGDLRVALETNAPLRAGRPVTLTFNVTDAAGQSLAPDIDLESGLRIDLYAIDESLTTFLVGEAVERSNLTFTLDFPKPGIYKLWLDFRYQGLRQVAFVVEVQ